MGVKIKKFLSLLIAVCMVAMSVANVQEVKVSADESANGPVTYEYYDEFGNPVTGTCNDYSVVTSVASGAAIGVASGGAISIASGGAISVVSGGAISVVSGGAISVVSGGAICVSGGAISCASGAAVTWGGDEEQWYVVEGNITVAERITVVTGAAVNLILKNGCKLTAGKGINVPAGSALNIFGQGGSSKPGQLIAVGSPCCAGIGGDDGQAGGSVTINGGIVTATGGYGAAGIGGGYGASGGEVTLSAGMSAFVSAYESYGYSPLTSGMTAGGRYVVAYPKYSGIMSASGNTVTATYIDETGVKSSVSLSLSALQAEGYVGSQIKIVSLQNLDLFNSALGKTGDNAVSESQIKYFTGAGVPLAAAPINPGDYIAEITVDGVTASLRYHTDVNPLVAYKYYDGLNGWVTGTCSDYSVVSNTTTDWDGDEQAWRIVHGDVFINDLVTVTGSVGLILMDGSTLYADKGINVAGGASLSIYGQGLGQSSIGRINAYGEYGQAGIGGGEYEISGSISIHGGNISAYGGTGAAGIGSGYNSVGAGVCGTVAIYGGQVTAGGGYVETAGDPTMPTTMGAGGAGIGAGYNGANIGVYVGTGVKAFASDNDWMYSPIGEGYSNSGRFALAYPEGSAVMSAYGNTLYATYVDAYGYRSSARLALKEPSEVYGIDESKKVTLEDVDSFNAALGRTGDDAVSESQIIYYTNRSHEVYTYYPTWTGSFTAKLTVDSVVLALVYDIDYISVKGSETYWDGYSHQCYVCDSTETFNERIWVYGTVNLVLKRGCRINATKGINVGWGSTLNIYSLDDESTYRPIGELIAHGFDYQAGIGGDYYGDAGTIVINGGVIDASGGYYAAGIGGGYGGEGGTIIINGGTVTAQGDMHGAGIGSGRYWDRFGTGYVYGGNITINGGTVTARGRTRSAGIGGGHGGSGGTIKINGGIVNAFGDGAAGIGGGTSGPGGDVTISGGSIRAEGEPAIGTNQQRYLGTITIDPGMKAFMSDDDMSYTQFYGATTDMDAKVLAYRENSGVMSVSGNTVTATYIDQNGIKQSVSTSITARTGVIYGEQSDILAHLENVAAFNAALGKTGAGAVSESQIKYYRWGVSRLQVTPSGTDRYLAEIAIDDATVVLDYEVVLNPTVTYEYFDNNMNPVSAICEGYCAVKDGTATFDSDLHDWYVVGANVYLNERLNVSGSVNLILVDGAVLHAPRGINVASGSALAIYGQSSNSENPGCLYAYGDYNDAAIGGGYYETAGSITINGGRITATGGSSGAGIGGGSYGSGGNITINGGRITASGGTYAAGIGGGDWTTDGGNITINGGKITSVGGYCGAGIGGGWEGTGGNVTIRGGEIVATAGADYSGAGIGGGSGHETMCNISVNTGMKVFASGDQNHNYTPVTTGNTPGGRYALAYNEHSGIVSSAGNTITATYIDPNFDRSTVSLVLTAPRNKLYHIKSDSLPSLAGLDEFNRVLNKTGMRAVMQYQIRYFNANGEACGEEPTRDGTYTAKITVDGETAVISYTLTEPEYISVTGSDTVWNGTPDDCFVVRGYFTNNHRITVSGTVNLVLLGGSELKLFKGITVPEGSTLNIYGEGLDFSTLMATGEANQAGIGGEERGSVGTINIYGGKVIATGGYSGAGIGGGSYGSGGNINIYGGLVGATGGTYAAGIGGGDWYGAGGNITINGGTVTANGGDWGGAGIGGGWCGAGGNITINGGKVTATGNGSGAGVGGGLNGAGGNITINGGGVLATGGEWGGAGIGAGSGGIAGSLTLNNDMMVLTSLSEDSGYTEIPAGSTDEKRYAISYKRHSGFLTTSGRTINALYIDGNSCKNNVSVTLGLPGDLSYNCAIINRVEFNTALGKTGANEVTGANIKYYNGLGVELPKASRQSSIARLFVDDVMVRIDYMIFGG